MREERERVKKGKKKEEIKLQEASKIKEKKGKKQGQQLKRMKGGIRGNKKEYI